MTKDHVPKRRRGGAEGGGDLECSKELPWSSKEAVVGSFLRPMATLAPVRYLGC